MDITLEQSLAAGVQFVLNNDVTGVRPYFEEIPEAFYVPSVYFPVPVVEVQKVTLRSYRTTFSFEAHILDRTNWEAEARAAAIREALILYEMCIPVYTFEGELTGKSLRALEPYQRRIGENEVVLTIPIREYFAGEQEATKIQKFYYAWSMVKEMIYRRYLYGEQEAGNEG